MSARSTRPTFKPLPNKRFSRRSSRNCAGGAASRRCRTCSGFAENPMWLFGDSFDHYADLHEKYHVVAGAPVIGLGRGRFGTNGVSWTGSGNVMRALVPGSPTAGAFLSMAMRVAPASGGGSFGFAELWNGVTDCGHVVLQYNVSNGTITALRLYGGSLPLQTNYHSEVL